jgi:peptidylprolyl isomerase
MRVPLVCLVAALLVAGCGKAPKTAEGQPPADAAPAPESQAQPDTQAPPATTPMSINQAAPATPAPGTSGPIKAGSKVTFHFAMKVDGKVVQDSHGQQPMQYVQGSGQVFRQLETSLEGLKAGDKKSVTLKPEEAFGPRDAAAVQTVPKANIPGADSLRVGQTISGSNGGQRFNATVMKITKDDVTLDLNHPFAGKPVTFDVEIVSVE